MQQVHVLPFLSFWNFSDPWLVESVHVELVDRGPTALPEASGEGRGTTNMTKPVSV